MTWRIYTDGSAACGPDAAPGRRYPGGYAAVVEHGSDGYVVRGRQADTTNVRMELTAVIRALESITGWEATGHDLVEIHTDCSAVFSIVERRARGTLKHNRGRKDHDLWLELDAQLDRFKHVRFRDIPRGGHPIHRRAHCIAGVEAKALAQGLPDDMTILSGPERRAMVRENMKRLQRVGKTSVESAFDDAIAAVHEHRRSP